MAHAPKKTDSVYDFLYVDARRIGLLLSQFGQDGILTELTRATDETSETAAGVDLKIIKADNKSGERTGLSRRFDPQWLIPLLFLDAAKDMLVRNNVSATRIGQLALVTGRLAIIDLATLQTLWDVPQIQKMMAAGMPNNDAARGVQGDRNQQARIKAQTAGERAKLVKDILGVVKHLPHGLQARLRTTEGEMLWCGLRDDSLIGSAPDLMLKHGSVISGEWNLVGILDALPDTDDGDDGLFNQQTGLSYMATALGPLARVALGRSPDAFGMTPLLIFREVTI